MGDLVIVTTQETLPEKRGPGRDQIDIPVEEVRKLAAAGCTQADMAGHFGVSLRTIVRRMAEPEYADVYARGAAELDISLRKKQVEMALAGDRTMLIWLGKNRLGQADKVEHSGTGPGGAIELNVSARELLARRIDRLAERSGTNGNPSRSG